jgi:hypothetical protein
MASQKSTGGGTTSAPAVDDDATIIAAGASLGRSTRRTRLLQTAQEIGQEFVSPLQSAHNHIKSTTLTHLPGLQTIYSEKGLNHLAIAHKFLQKTAEHHSCGGRRQLCSRLSQIIIQGSNLEGG